MIVKYNGRANSSLMCAHMKRFPAGSTVLRRRADDCRPMSVPDGTTINVIVDHEIRPFAAFDLRNDAKLHGLLATLSGIAVAFSCVRCPP